MLRSLRWCAVLLLACAFPGLCGTQPNPDISIVADRRPGPAATYGLNRLVAALTAKGVTVERTDSLAQARGKRLLVAGLAAQEGPAARLLQEGRHPVPRGPEALVIRAIRWGGKPGWMIVGSDDRGLMYGELDVADRIGWSIGRDAAFSRVREADEKPDVSERAISLYTFNRAYWESRFYDEAYWTEYLDVLARNRFNTLVIIFGYENGGFLAPTGRTSWKRWRRESASWSGRAVSLKAPPTLVPRSDTGLSRPAASVRNRSSGFSRSRFRRPAGRCPSVSRSAIPLE